MGLTEELKELKELLHKEEEKKQEKKFKIPFMKKVGKAQKKKNFVTLVKLHENSGLEIKKVQIHDQTIVEDKIPRLAAGGYVFWFKNNPWIFLPSWSVEPIGKAQLFKKTIEDGTNVAGYEILLAALEREATKAKAQMGNMLKWILGLALAGVIIYALMTGGGG